MPRNLNLTPETFVNLVGSDDEDVILAQAADGTPPEGYLAALKDERERLPWATDAFGQVGVDAYGRAVAEVDGYTVAFTGFTRKQRQAGNGAVDVDEVRAYYKVGTPGGYHPNEGATVTLSALTVNAKKAAKKRATSAHAGPVYRATVATWNLDDALAAKVSEALAKELGLG